VLSHPTRRFARPIVVHTQVLLAWFRFLAEVILLVEFKIARFQALLGMKLRGGLLISHLFFFPLLPLSSGTTTFGSGI
jgi:hypothetical protein